MSLHDRHLRQYVRATMASELLDAETETALALAWRDHRDEAALHRLIRAYQRLAVSMAGRFRRHDVSYDDLIQQGMLGLMRAAEKFDPENGARFSTYAIWWIRASMQDYVMRNWSLVRTGTNATQKKLFFHLRKALSRDQLTADGASGQIARLSAALDVPEAEIEAMMGRMSGPDMSLDAPQSDERRSWVDALEDDAPATETAVMDRLDTTRQRAVLRAALAHLPEREQRIVEARHLRDDPATLSDLGVELGVSKERVRQLEERALARLTERARAEFSA